MIRFSAICSTQPVHLPSCADRLVRKSLPISKFVRATELKFCLAECGEHCAEPCILKRCSERDTKTNH